MKNIKIRMLFKAMLYVIISIIIGGCTKSAYHTKDSPFNNDSNLKTESLHHIGMLVRHSEIPGHICIRIGSKCAYCPCWGGLCYCPGIIDAASLTLQDIEEGYRTMYVEEINGKLHFIFESDVALSDGTIPIPDDYVLSQVELDLLSISSAVKVLAGTYTVDFSTYTYGEVWMDLENL